MRLRASSNRDFVLSGLFMLGLASAVLAIEFAPPKSPETLSVSGMGCAASNAAYHANARRSQTDMLRVMRDCLAESETSEWAMQQAMLKVLHRGRGLCPRSPRKGEAKGPDWEHCVGSITLREWWVPMQQPHAGEALASATHKARNAMANGTWDVRATTGLTRYDREMVLERLHAAYAMANPPGREASLRDYYTARDAWSGLRQPVVVMGVLTGLMLVLQGIPRATFRRRRRVEEDDPLMIRC